MTISCLEMRKECAIKFFEVENFLRLKEMIRTLKEGKITVQKIYLRKISEEEKLFHSTVIQLN